MPYKNPEHKRQWELHNRAQRLARRRELRRIATARKTDQPEPARIEEGGVGFLWLPIAGAVAMASYSPKLAIGTGGLTLAAAAALKKGWGWWIVGLTVLALGVFFRSNNLNRNKRNRKQNSNFWVERVARPEVSSATEQQLAFDCLKRTIPRENKK